MRGAGRVVFAALMLLLLGTLNVIYGFGAIDDANVFVNDTRLVFSDLNTYGWILILLGAVQLGAGGSLMSGNAFGRVFGDRGRQPRRADRPDLRRLAHSRGTRSQCSSSASGLFTESSCSAKTNGIPRRSDPRVGRRASAQSPTPASAPGSLRRGGWRARPPAASSASSSPAERAQVTASAREETPSLL